MKHLVLILSLSVTIHFSYSQINYMAVNGVNTTGSYVDLGTNGSAISTASFDDANSAPQEIGFNFTFNGTVFTQFILNTNGVIKLGGTAPGEIKLDNALASAETNLIYPLNLDLIGGTAPEYRLNTQGRSPKRVCIIQFKNVADYFATPANASQFSNMSFQIRLYETSNNIEFIYSGFAAGEAAAASLTGRVGIKGNDAASSVNVTKGSAEAWSTSTFIDGNYVTNAHNIRNTVLPGTGQTYVFKSSSALPVKLSGFTGSMQNNTALLSWITQYENNNSRFEVERSAGASTAWIKTGTIEAIGTSSATNRYQFTDAGVGNGKWLYRLKIVDKDGKFNYSPIVVLTAKGKPVFSLGQNYPNPVKDITMIGYELGNDAVVSIELYTIDGKKIMTRQEGKQAKGAYNFQLDAAALSLTPGKYIYRLLVKNNLTGELTIANKQMSVVR